MWTEFYSIEQNSAADRIASTVRSDDAKQPAEGRVSSFGGLSFDLRDPSTGLWHYSMKDHASEYIDPPVQHRAVKPALCPIHFLVFVKFSVANIFSQSNAVGLVMEERALRQNNDIYRLHVVLQTCSDRIFDIIDGVTIV